MTILGYHTAHELSDWIDALTVEMQDLGAAREGAAGKAYAVGPVWSAWFSDHDALASDWAAVRRKCAAEVLAARASFGGWDDVTDEDLWTQVALTFDPTSTDHSRLGDLTRRWPSLPGNPNALYASRPVPQPSAPDSDLNALNSVAKVDVLGNAINSPTKTKAWLILGGLATIVVFGLVVRR